MCAYVDFLPSSISSTNSPDTSTSTSGYIQGDTATTTTDETSGSSRVVVHRSRRRLDQENGIDYSSGEGGDVEVLSTVDDDEEGASAASLAQQRSATETVCSPVGECSVCPHNWRVMIEKEDEKIQGEWDSCKSYGRRRKRQCNVLFRDDALNGEKVHSRYEYKECKFTPSDEQFRVVGDNPGSGAFLSFSNQIGLCSPHQFRMQMICLLVGLWALRNVKRHKVASASLFDQRRLRLQGGASSSNGSSGSRKFDRKNSVSEEMIELMPPRSGVDKFSKSPAPAKFVAV
ncbi:hypothetical protein THAOC_13584 [Thalassiosira oceanica]|uniref:Uncharacterized protein n=1 Tax=Thalassiosira oceanica TaxID=159749 RepID=K0SX25_THAOC|nr:hypothetical protein THAOC_13584 [Thalassiosira oceanica]|eukprot:EJK65541.1 hypothetical protein THAOC_13584 [Thalassiosira oceanica]